VLCAIISTIRANPIFLTQRGADRSIGAVIIIVRRALI